MSVQAIITDANGSQVAVRALYAMTFSNPGNH